MEWDYYYSANNKSSNVTALVFILLIVIAGFLIAYFVFDSPWWIYVGIGMAGVVFMFAAIQEVHDSGGWEIMLDRERGGRIVSPNGCFDFDVERLEGVVMAVSHSRYGGEHRAGGYVLVFSDCWLDLNHTPLKIFELKKEIRRLWPEKPLLGGKGLMRGVDFLEIEAGRHPIEWKGEEGSPN